MATDAPRHRPRRLGLDELANRLGLEPERVRRLVDAGAIECSVDGTFEPGDVHRVRLLSAFEASGVPLDALVRAYRGGRVTFAFYDELHPEPGALATQAYEGFAASLGDEAPLLPRLFAAFGLAEPSPGTRLTRDEEALLAELVASIAGTGEPDLALRVIRTTGEGARRAADAALGAYEDAVAPHLEAADQVPPEAFMDQWLRPWARVAHLMSPLAAWLAGRHLTRAIDDYSVQQTEDVLATAGLVAPHEDAPRAVAFVDLTGFTRFTELHGDRAAAAIAIRLGEVAAEAVGLQGGRVIKLLGDGVLVRYPELVAAVDGALALLDAIPRAGLPGGHAGVASGTLVERDGDVFGRTVNLAARLAGAAADGDLLLRADQAAALPRDRFTVQAAGAAELHGVAVTELALVRRAPADA